MGCAGRNLRQPGLRRIHCDRRDLRHARRRTACLAGRARSRSAAGGEHHGAGGVDDAGCEQRGRSCARNIDTCEEAGQMKRAQKIALVLLGLVALASLFAGVLAPSSYSEQFRDSLSASPSARFPLGTDELGRDRFARLLYGTRVSLILAPAAALLSTLISALVGGTAARLGGKWGRAVTGRVDPFLSLPLVVMFLSLP